MKDIFASPLLFAMTFLISLQFSNSSADDSPDDCVQKSPCVCEYKDGGKIDLTHFGEEAPGADKFYSASLENLTYFFHPCTDAPLKDIPTNITTNKCQNPLSLCLFNKVNRTLTELGNAKDAKFRRVNPNSKPQLVFSSGAGENSTTTSIFLSCSDVEKNLLFGVSEVNQQHVLFLSSPAACIVHQKHEKSISTGTTLLIIFFVMSCVYLVGGGLVLRLIRGARGCEMVPNLDFWTDLPALVRDGALFILGGCSFINKADTYDRI